MERRPLPLGPRSHPAHRIWGHTMTGTTARPPSRHRALTPTRGCRLGARTFRFCQPLLAENPRWIAAPHQGSGRAEAARGSTAGASSQRQDGPTTQHLWGSFPWQQGRATRRALNCTSRAGDSNAGGIQCCSYPPNGCAGGSGGGRQGGGAGRTAYCGSGQRAGEGVQGRGNSAHTARRQPLGTDPALAPSRYRTRQPRKDSPRLGALHWASSAARPSEPRPLRVGTVKSAPAAGAAAFALVRHAPSSPVPSLPRGRSNCVPSPCASPRLWAAPFRATTRSTAPPSTVPESRCRRLADIHKTLPNR